MRIKDISSENRPRERMIKSGVSSLSDAELLAVLMKTGTREENVIDMSNRLISKYGASRLSSCSLKELQEIKGIGKAKGCQIIALFEFARRHSNTVSSKSPVKSAKDVFDIIRPKIAYLEKEHFAVLMLDTKNRPIKEEIVSIGTLNASIVHPREIFRSAIKEGANSVIIAHNHPSGDPKPSVADRKITEDLISAGDIIGIKVLDHVIIGKDNYWSFNGETD